MSQYNGNDGIIESAESVFKANPKTSGHLELLREIGVVAYVDGLTDTVNSFRTLCRGGMGIFECANIDDILEVTVEYLYGLYSPSFIAFLWKPVANHSDITTRTYCNGKLVGMKLKLDSIAAFEPIFMNRSKPLPFEELESRIGDADVIAAMSEVEPELVVPITGPNDLHGIVLVGRRIDDFAYSEHEISFLHRFMFFVSNAIKNNLTYEHSLRDIKTGLYNHGFFMTRVKEEVSRMRRSNGASSVIIMDVDRFKVFNDTYGHLAGDQVLESLAHVIKENVRTHDIPSRFGGEEFTILLPDAESATALMVAERLRMNVSRMRVKWETELPPITISLGVFSFNQDDDVKTDDIMKRADEALYASKAGGRNCTTVWKHGLLEGFAERRDCGESR